MADLSPGVRSGWWLGDATYAVAGARFRGRCRRGWRRVEFVELDSGRTMVTEGYVDQRRPVLRRASGLIIGSTDGAARIDDTMHTTLGCLKAAAGADGRSSR